MPKIRARPASSELRPRRSRRPSKSSLITGYDRHVFDERVGENLRRRRLELGLTLQQAGALIGISFQRLQQHETGKHSLRLWLAVEICRALDLPLVELAAAPRRLTLRLSIPKELPPDTEDVSRSLTQI